MEIEVDVSVPRTIVKHPGERDLEFSASVFTRPAFSNKYNVFAEINDYWASLPLPRQAAIYDLYREAERGFDQIKSSEDLYRQLNRIVQHLFELHPLEELEIWISMNPKIRIPSSFQETFVADRDSNATAEKTYTRREYIQVISLALFIRTLIPIWGEYISSTRKVSGMAHKEQVAFELLSNTDVLRSPAVIRLKEYIVQTIKDRQNNMAKILNSISSEDVPHILLALVCVRRLSTGDISDAESRGESHIVSRIYHYVLQQAGSQNNKNPEIRAKPLEQSDSSDQKQRSILESYRKLAELTVGELAELEFAMEMVEANVLRLAPDIDRAHLRACIESAQALKDERLGDPQLLLLAWTFKTVLVPQSVHYVPKPQLISALGGLEALLWHWNHRYLAILATSHLVYGAEDLIISPIDSRSQIPDELKQQIYKYYPFRWSIMKRNTQQVEENHGVLEAIDLLVDELISNAWRSTASEANLIEVFGEVRRKFPIVPTIKQELAKLIIDIEARRGPVQAYPEVY